jgi:hypothetical protein
MLAFGCQKQMAKFDAEKQPIRNETAIFISGEVALYLAYTAFLGAATA